MTTLDEQENEEFSPSSPDKQRRNRTNGGGFIKLQKMVHDDFEQESPIKDNL